MTKEKTVNKQITRFVAQREVWDDGERRWEDHFEGSQRLYDIEQALEQSLRKLDDRRPLSLTGRFRIICRSVTEYDVGSIIDINVPI
jgi:hypothetical protein